MNLQLVGIVNEFTPGEDGWAMLAPYGDYPGTILAMKDGKPERREAIQRVDKEAVATMVNEFNGFLGKVKRYLYGRNLYVGHPDVAAIANEYPTKEPVGVFSALEAREDGLWGKPIFTNDGMNLIERGEYKHMSAHWDATVIGEDKGKLVCRPIVFKSAGLTNRPNLPVKQFINEKDDMRKEIDIIGFLKKCNVLDVGPNTAMNEFTVALNKVADLVAERAQFANENATLKEAKTTSESVIANLTTERDGLKTKLADTETRLTQSETAFTNERAARITEILDHATASGKLTPAERLPWSEKLTANFANELQELQKISRKVKTTAMSENLGERKVTIANETERKNKVQELVNAKIAGGLNYDQAFNAVEKENPALFSDMKMPGK